MTVRPWAFLALAFPLFLAIATANAGGYRYGVSDQAFYVPAIALRADPALFPRDRDVIEPQMRLWIGDEILGALVRTTGIDLPTLFGVTYVVTMAALVAAAALLARALGCSWWTIALVIAVMTLRHRIPRTGANSLEGYMHPRMLAFAIGVFALAAVARLRWTTAIACVVAAAVVHTSTALWFAGAVFVAALWVTRARVWWLTAAAAVGVAGLVAARLAVPGMFATMDVEWLTVLADRDYLFSLQWPAWAWLLNLGYALAIVLVYVRRRAKGVATHGEAALVAGLLSLVVVFAATLPFTAARVHFFVQLQANRIFWLLDLTAVIYLAWAVMDDVAARGTWRRRAAIVALVAALASARGAYILQTETSRQLIQATLPDNDWTATMRWLSTQPASWHVLADPGHAWLFGSSVRVAALRDTLLELGKDPAMAMYDRALAHRVAERTRALAHFDRMTADDVLRLDAAYDLDVLIDHASRRFDLPVLFENAGFIAYDLR